MNKLLLFFVLIIGLQACNSDLKSPIGFSPPKGDAVRGEKVL